MSGWCLVEPDPAQARKIIPNLKRPVTSVVADFATALALLAGGLVDGVIISSVRQLNGVVEPAGGSWWAIAAQAAQAARNDQRRPVRLFPRSEMAKETKR